MPDRDPEADKARARLPALSHDRDFTGPGS